jgi:hypothetical protein
VYSYAKEKTGYWLSGWASICQANLMVSPVQTPLYTKLEKNVSGFKQGLRFHGVNIYNVLFRVVTPNGSVCDYRRFESNPQFLVSE